MTQWRQSKSGTDDGSGGSYEGNQVGRPRTSRIGEQNREMKRMFRCGKWGTGVGEWWIYGVRSTVARLRPSIQSTDF